jgi:S-(hydroxymethyl)glutathione dehydrogenase/alcohol dehydrogenase
VISGTCCGSVRPDIDCPILGNLDIEKKIDLDNLISSTYGFDELNEDFRLMLAGEVARGVIVFD